MNLVREPQYFTKYFFDDVSWQTDKHFFSRNIYHHLLTIDQISLGDIFYLKLWSLIRIFKNSIIVYFIYLRKASSKLWVLDQQDASIS